MVPVQTNPRAKMRGGEQLKADWVGTVKQVKSQHRKAGVKKWLSTSVRGQEKRPERLQPGEPEHINKQELTTQSSLPTVRGQ